MVKTKKFIKKLSSILYPLSSNYGFTLIELLVVTAVMGILLATGLVSYNSFNRKRIVREASLDLLNNFRYAQGKALSGEKPSFGCGVLDGWKLEFDGTGYDYKIQAICDIGSEAGDAKTFSFPTDVSRNACSDYFLFKVLAQGVSYDESIPSPTEIILSGFGYQYKIKVTQSGEINDEGLQ